jgi:hypothetical protein
MAGGEVARYMSRHGGKSVVRTALISSVVPYMLQSDSNPQGTERTVFDAMAEQMRDDRAKFFHAFFKDFFGNEALPHGVKGSSGTRIGMPPAYFHVKCSMPYGQKLLATSINNPWTN